MYINEQTLNIILSFCLFMFGASIGSFLNVVSLRLPKNISIVTKSSECPTCYHKIVWWALIPIFGYFLTKAKCTKCKAKISMRYPIVECITGVLTLISIYSYSTPTNILTNLGYLGFEPVIGTYKYQDLFLIMSALWLCYTGIVLSLIDLDLRILPDVITLPGTIISLILGAINPYVGWQNALTGMLVGAGGIFLIAISYSFLRKKEGLGFGDVKYLGFLGAIVGWQGVIQIIAIASALGSIIGIFIMIIKKENMNLALPFGPFLAFAGWVVFLWGDIISKILYPL